MNQEAQQPETVEIQDVNQFVTLTAAWHARAVAQAEHFKNVPEGQEIRIGDGPSIKLEGNILRGMKIGIDLALMSLGTLPFAAEMEEGDDEQPAAAGG